MALQVAEHRKVLLDIEISVKPEAKEMGPLKPMIATLEAYVRDSGIKLTKQEILTKLGGHTSKYYQICQLMTKMYLLGDAEKKKRGLILSGAHNSGKSTIGRFISDIFDSHTLS